MCVKGTEDKRNIEEMALAICKSRGVADVDDCRKCWQHENSCLYQDIACGLYREDYRKQSEWISVEERLPEKYAYVIVCDEDGTVGEAFCYKEGGFEWMYSQEIAFVTHWMPLPEPPKMKGGAE